MTQALSDFERRIDRVQAQHPEMPRQAVSLIRLSYHVFRTLSDRLDRFFGTQRLSTSEWAVLMMVYSTPDRSLTPSELSSAVVQSRTHMTRVADDLVEAGLIERVRDLGDRRRVALRLTARGEELIGQLLPAVWSQYQTALAAFSPDQTAELESLLRHWLAHLEALDRPSAAGASDGQGRG